MELSRRVQDFISQISIEQEKVAQKILSLKNEGILDESLEDYLKDSISELQDQKEKLIKDFSQNAYSRSTAQTGQIFLNKELIKKKPYQEPVSLVKQPYSQDCPGTIFSKKTSPERGNSPSARRYSPQYFDINEKIDKIKNYSPICSTRSSRSSVEKITIELEKINEELITKYEEQREIRNKAHEKMLLLKEKMLYDKEMKLEEALKKVQMRKPIKPPKSPKPFQKPNDKITDLVQTLIGIPKSRVNNYINLVKHQRFVEHLD